jgi:hypothetical protein
MQISPSPYCAVLWIFKQSDVFASSHGVCVSSPFSLLLEIPSGPSIISTFPLVSGLRLGLVLGLVLGLGLGSGLPVTISFLILTILYQEFCAGGDLDDAMKDYPEVIMRRAGEIAFQTTAALDYLHGKGVIHRECVAILVVLSRNVSLCLLNILGSCLSINSPVTFAFDFVCFEFAVSSQEMFS